MSGRRVVTLGSDRGGARGYGPCHGNNRYFSRYRYTADRWTSKAYVGCLTA